MRYFTDEHNVIWSENALKDYYKHLIETKEIDSETFPTFEDWLDEVINHACTFEEMKVSDYDRMFQTFQKESGSMEINLLYVDKQELPSVLTALIKQNLYRWNNEKQEDGCSIEAAKEHIEAEIAKTERLAKSLYSLLSILKSLFEVKYESSKAYHVAIDCDIKSDLLGQIGTIDDNMEEEIASVICSIGKMLELIVPEFKSDSLICEEWFYEDSEYIDTLMYWCKNLNIEML